MKSAAPRFTDLTVSRVMPEAAGAVALALHVPDAQRERFSFQSGQYITLRTRLDGQDVRRCYSICNTPQQFQASGELLLGIRPMQGGVFSNWAASTLKPGDVIAALPPDGRFTVQRPRALHRVGFAAGSGITPILSILSSTLQADPQAQFTLVYGNRNMGSILFNEALQDLKDRFGSRLTLIHILSRQAQEVDLLQGRIDADKVRALLATLLPAASMDEVFICGPEAMISATEATLLAAGVSPKAIRIERFSSPTLDALPPEQRQQAAAPRAVLSQGDVALSVVLDGKTHALRMAPEQTVLDVALGAGLDLPYACKGGVCCTCRARVLEGQTQMDKNFGLEADEVARGFVLTCQAHPVGQALRLSFDER